MSTIRGTGLSHYRELVGELGADPERLLRAAGVDPAAVGERDAFIPYRGLIEAVESAAAVTDTVDFGRRLGRLQGIEILGPVGVAARTAHTVADAVGIFETYMGAYSPAISTTFTDVGGTSQTRFEFRILLADPPPAPQTLELSLTVARRVLQTLIAPDWAPTTVHLPHDRLGPRRGYVEAYGCRPRFAERFAGLSFPRRHLDQPLRGDVVTHLALLDYLETVAADGSAGIVPRVRDLVRQLLPAGSATLEVVAEQFSLHPRALQRRLAEGGTTFSDIVDTTRRDVATRYLRDTDLPMSQIARELGYAEQSVLTRSARRWFGHGPLAERERLRSAR